MLKIHSFLLIVCCLFPLMALAQQRPIVRDIHFSSPKALPEDTLLIPRYDFLDAEDGALGPRRDFIVNVNRAAKKSNTTLNDVVRKAYPFPYKLISLSEVDWYQDHGYRYFLDMTLMPKQMKHPNPEAMVPCWVKYKTANKMYKNRNVMWHYYFYIRDLQTDNAYMTSKMSGKAEVYAAMRQVLSRAGKEGK